MGKFVQDNKQELFYCKASHATTQPNMVKHSEPDCVPYYECTVCHSTFTFFNGETSED